MGDIQRALTIDGWMSPGELQWLSEIVKGKETVLEVGCYKGRSARAMADNFNGVLVCLDTWNAVLYDSQGAFQCEVNTETYNEFRDNIFSPQPKSRVIIYRGDLFDLITEMPPVKFDFIFIDADHEYEAVKRDIKVALQLLNKKGILAGHDYAGYWPGVMKAVDECVGPVATVGTIWYKDAESIFKNEIARGYSTNMA